MDPFGIKMNDELGDMIRGFVEESQESFDNIEMDLLTIETHPEDLNIINSVFRVMHTIKGTAGFLELDDISALSHKIESIFDIIRRKEIDITPELMDIILPAIDLLKQMVFELIETEKSDYNLTATIQYLKTVIDSKPSDFTATRAIDHLIGSGKIVLSSEEEDQSIINTEDTSHISPELREDFVIEAEEHLETIEDSLLRLEKSPEDETSINEVFRAIHSIKGTSDYVNIKRITILSHALETIFDYIRKGTQKYSYELADVVLKGVDVLKKLVYLLSINDVGTAVDLTEILEQLNHFIETDISETEIISEAALQTELKRIIIDNEHGTPTRAPVFLAEAPPLAGTSLTQLDQPKSTFRAFLNIAAQQLQIIQYMGSSFVQNELDENEFKVLSRALKTLGDSANNAGFKKIVTYSAQLVNFINGVANQTLSMDSTNDSILRLIENLSDEIQQITTDGNRYLPEVIINQQSTIIHQEAIEQEKSVTLNTTGIKPISNQEDSTIKTMRVDADRLDTFMNLIGEIIITRNTYSHLLGELAIEAVPQTLLKELKTVETSFNRISEDLQITLMKMRLISIKSIFQKIPRIVRDISRKTNKKIQLQIAGEETEIDKSIIEIIGDPLLHIIRNSCDHGIESSEERIKAGKTATGSIILKASHLGGEIAIDIIDDGAGINTARVLDIAIEKGLVSLEESRKLDKKAIVNFIFHPGFSTASEVSDISGRGVGMDVVNANIKKIHGAVTVESEAGQGTHIRLLLPLTLSVVDALMVINQNQKFAIPLDSIMETIKVRQSKLQKIKKKEAISLRGEIIGVSRLTDLLEGEPVNTDPDAILSIVILQVGSRVMGIVVDDLSNQQEIVVKPLQKYLTTIPGINGSAILGNGEIILILDPTELIDLASI